MDTKTLSRGRTRALAECALMAAVIALCAWISIPAAVPFTLQTFGIFAAVAILGGKRGSAAVAVYLLMGMVGLPLRDLKEGSASFWGPPAAISWAFWALP